MNMDSTIRNMVIFVALFCLGVNAAAQENCEPTQSKKAQKILDRVYSAERHTPDEIEAMLTEALEADNECLSCRFGLARIQYQIATDRNQSYDRALDNFDKVIKQCAIFHSDAYYYAGIISYGNQDYENALHYFESFLTFDKELGKSSRDYEIKEKDVATVLPEIRFYVDFYANPVPFNPVRLNGINTPADEYLPMLSPDNELIFFTRKEMLKAKGDLYAREVENFMQAAVNADGSDFQNPQPLPPPFNIGDNYGGVSISLDNREMFVTVCKPVTSSYKNCDIYVTSYERKVETDGKISYKWSGLENLGPNVNTEDGWEAQPTLSADGNELYFASVRENSTPDKDGNPTIDIYYTKRNGDGTWSPAKPIEGEINTAGNDKSPFLHVDSRTLYFSSNGRIGAGGYDIYFCKQEEDGSWSKPKNLGYPINSTQDEHGLVVSTDGKRAYFASSKVQTARGLDIFAFEVPQKARPDKVLLIKGEAKNADGEIITEARIELKYTKSKEVREVDVNKHDGSYAAVINLKKEEDVVVSVKSDSEELAFNTRVFTMADTANTVQTIDMKIDKIREGKTYRINDIRFKTGSSELNEESKRVLDEFADYLNENRTLKIEVGGHTDNVGDPTRNMVLSTDRAFEVFGYLQAAGVEGNRMNFKGYGETTPVAPNDSEVNRAKNRRTEFKITRL